jgi:hypothetical protein
VTIYDDLVECSRVARETHGDPPRTAFTPRTGPLVVCGDRWLARVKELVPTVATAGVFRGIPLITSTACDPRRAFLVSGDSVVSLGIVAEEEGVA